jgi:hypothetical protein
LQPIRLADGWCRFVLREKYCWLVVDGWFLLREKYCWLVADKPNEQSIEVVAMYFMTIRFSDFKHLLFGW